MQDRLKNHTTPSGLFVSFEGIDFSGKSTQLTMLTEKLDEEQRVYKLVREPGNTTISEQIRAILLNKNNTTMSEKTELLLYGAARRQLVDEIIKSCLEQKGIVIADRYVDSTRAYQGARGISKETLETVIKLATDGLSPHRTYILDIPIKVMITRRDKMELDRLESAGKNFFKQVRENYLRLSKENPDRVKVIDGTQTVQTIHEEIYNDFKTLYNKLKIV